MSNATDISKLYATAKRVADGAVLAVVEPTLFKAETPEAAVPANLTPVNGGQKRLSSTGKNVRNVCSAHLSAQTAVFR